MACAPPGCYLLLVLGQPCALEHKEHILGKVSKGLLSWDVNSTRCDLQALEPICSNLKASKDVDSELLIQYSTENLAVEVLLNPQVNTLKQCLKNLLAANVGHKHVIHAGYAFTGSGSWMLQDGSFSYEDFMDTLLDSDVQKELRRHPGCTIHVHCIPEGPWASQGDEHGALSRMHESLFINPASTVSTVPGSGPFLDCLSLVLRSHPLTEMMKSSPVVGNIRFNKPTLYVFPGGQGDCALFGVSGFTMLIDGGFSRKPCFWEFIRHLDRLDAIMITRLNENNVCGITNVIRRKREGKRVYPQVGYVFCNVAEGKQSPTSPGSSAERDPLLVSVIREGHEFSENLYQLGLKPHRCLRDSLSEPLTLFHKVGHGTLEMYVLSPPKDSKEMKQFFQQWTSYKEHFSYKRRDDDRELPIPLCNAMSICALLIWKPADPSDTITRVLLPGSAPQSKIFEGLEHLRHLDELRYRTCSQMSLGIKYEERVKIKTTKKHIAKVSKQKSEVVRPSSPIKTAREVEEQLKSLRKRAESPIKSLTGSPVRRVKKASKMSEEKKVLAAEITAKKLISKDIKAVPKKVSRKAKTKRAIREEDRITKDEEKSVEAVADELESEEPKALPSDETEEVKEAEDTKEKEMIGEKELPETKEDKELEKFVLESEKPEEIKSESEEMVEEKESEEQKLLQELEEKEKTEEVLELMEEPITPVDREKERGIVLELEKPDEKEFQATTDEKELQSTTEEKEIKKEEENDSLKSSPGVEEIIKSPATPEKEEVKVSKKDISTKPSKKAKLPSKKSATPRSTMITPSARPIKTKMRKDTEVHKDVMKKEKVEKEVKPKVTSKPTKAIPKVSDISLPKPKPLRPVRDTIKPVAATKVSSRPQTKKPEVSEIKTKGVKDVVNKRVAESKVTSRHLELVKTKAPSPPLPKSPMKKPKEKLPLASPKKKPKSSAISTARSAKPSKEKTKPKPVKRPVKPKDVAPSEPDEKEKPTTPEVEGPITPEEEIIPSKSPSPLGEISSKEVEALVEEGPSSPKKTEDEILVSEEMPEIIPSEVDKEIELPKDEEAKEMPVSEPEIIDEQMVVKEIEAVEAAVDELIEGMRTGIEESKAKIPKEVKEILTDDETIKEVEAVEVSSFEEELPEGKEEVVTSDVLKEQLQSEPIVKGAIYLLLEELKLEDQSQDNEMVVFEVICEEMESKSMSLDKNSMIKYITEFRIEIISIIRRKLITKEEERVIDEREKVKEKDEIEEELIIPQYAKKEEHALFAKAPKPEMVPKIKDEELVEEKEVPSEILTEEEIYELLTPEIRNYVAEIIKQTEIKDIDRKEYYTVILKFISKELCKEGLQITITNIIQYIIEYKTVIIKRARNLLEAVEIIETEKAKISEEADIEEKEDVEELEKEVKGKITALEELDATYEKPVIEAEIERKEEAVEELKAETEKEGTEKDVKEKSEKVAEDEKSEREEVAETETEGKIEIAEEVAEKGKFQFEEKAAEEIQIEEKVEEEKDESEVEQEKVEIKEKEDEEKGERATDIKKAKIKEVDIKQIEAQMIKEKDITAHVITPEKDRKELEEVNKAAEADERVQETVEEKADKAEIDGKEEREIIAKAEEREAATEAKEEEEIVQSGMEKSEAGEKEAKEPQGKQAEQKEEEIKALEKAEIERKDIELEEEKTPTEEEEKIEALEKAEIENKEDIELEEEKAQIEEKEEIETGEKAEIERKEE